MPWGRYVDSPRLQGFVGAQSQIDIIAASAHLSGQKLLSTLTTELAIDEDSHVRYMQAPLDVFKQGWYFDAFRVDLKRNSTLKTIMASEGSASMRHDYHVALMGENAEASLNGVWMLSGSHEAHANILMEHQAPHCRSMQLLKAFWATIATQVLRAKFMFIHLRKNWSLPIEQQLALKR